MNISIGICCESLNSILIRNDCLYSHERRDGKWRQYCGQTVGGILRETPGMAVWWPDKWRRMERDARHGLTVGCMMERDARHGVFTLGYEYNFR